MGTEFGKKFNTEVKKLINQRKVIIVLTKLGALILSNCCQP